jgi:hypothetical protein
MASLKSSVISEFSSIIDNKTVFRILQRRGKIQGRNKFISG